MRTSWDRPVRPRGSGCRVKLIEKQSIRRNKNNLIPKWLKMRNWSYKENEELDHVVVFQVIEVRSTHLILRLPSWILKSQILDAHWLKEKNSNEFKLNWAYIIWITQRKVKLIIRNFTLKTNLCQRFDFVLFDVSIKSSNLSWWLNTTLYRYS